MRFEIFVLTDYVLNLVVNLKLTYTGKKGNFVKHVENMVEELGVPYDYDSVMHYGKYYFSRNGQYIVNMHNQSIS